MNQRDGLSNAAVLTGMLADTARRVLVRCAVCERDQALVRSHEAADRVLHSHMDSCPGPSSELPAEAP